MRRGLQWGALVACVVTVVACGDTGGANDTETAAGTTTSDPAPPPITSPALLDAGPYPTRARPPLGVATGPGAGVVADAQHLADFTLGPWEVDEVLVDPYLSSYYVIDSPNTLQQLGPEGVAAAAGRHGLINGFASARQAPDKAVMINAVLRFADPATAVAAAGDMGEASAKQAVKGVVPTVVPIPGHPDTAASTYPFSAKDSDPVRATVRAFTAHGPYVLMQFVQSTGGVDAATAMVAKAIDAQGPLIDQFTPAGDLAAVPLDPTGLLAKTLPAGPGANTAKNAVYGTRGAEHFQSDPVSSANLFSDAGMTDVAMGNTNVYQTRDERSAVMVTNAFSEEVSAGEGAGPAAAVPQPPDSQCWALPKAFYCVAPAGRFAIEGRSATLPDVQQQVAAQYVMLTAK